MNEYLDFQESKIRPSKEGEKPSLIQDAMKYHLDTLAAETGISADELAENIQNDQNPRRAVNNNVPKVQEISPSDAVDLYVNQESRFLVTKYQVLDNLCLLIGNEIFYHPEIR